MEFYPSFGFFGFFKFFFMLAVGFKETIQFHSFVSIIIVSLLLGVLFSLIAYKVNLGKGSGEKTVGLFGGTGLFLAAFAPGCVACGVGLASALGIGAGFLSFFPYDGLELSIASITILVFAVVRVTKNMYICKTSPLMFNRVMKGGRKYE